MGKGLNQKDQQRNSLEGFVNLDPVVVTYYTDPLCCWSFAFESIWQSFLAKHSESIQLSYVMAGMIKDWGTYSDPLNAVSNPLQMGPVWMHAAQLSNIKMNAAIWHTDAPTSSYPSCIAVKAAGLQSKEAESIYLQWVRKAVFLEEKNISKKSVLLNVGSNLAEVFIGFDFHRFEKEIDSNKAKEEFRADLKKAAFHKIGRFPTITFVNPGSGTGLAMTGYRSLEAVENIFYSVLHKMNPDEITSK